MKKIFLLYDNINQSKLLAAAYTIKERKEVTQKYSDGQWFSYEIDPKNEHIFFGDTEKKIKVKFTKK